MKFLILERNLELRPVNQSMKKIKMLQVGFGPAQTFFQGNFNMF